MDMIQAMENRHSVRNYLDRKIEAPIIGELQNEIDKCNQESGLHIQLIVEEPDAFGSILVHYGLFKQVKNYIALIGKEEATLEEKSGYYGEQIVLKAQQLGLNTCWVALTYSKKKNRCQIAEGEKLVCVIALGYGKNQGKPHKNKPIEKLCKTEDTPPEWFQKGMEAVMLAPTAINQQKFLFTLKNETVIATSAKGPYSNVDLGIAKKHFEVGGSYRFPSL